MCGGGSNSGDNDKQSLKEQAKNKKTPFSAETFGKMSPETAAKFQGQSFAMGDDAQANAAANAAYDAGAQIRAENDRALQERQANWAASGGFLHGGPGSPQDPNWDNYTIGEQLNYMGKALGGTLADIGVGVYNVYSNTLGTPGTLINNALQGTSGTIFGRPTPHWSDSFFSDPDGLLGPNDEEAQTFGGQVEGDLPTITNTVAPVQTINVEDIEPRVLGGLFEKGKAYLVGEQGPEVVVAGEDGQGQVVPNVATIQGDNVVPMPMKKPTASDRFLGDFSFIQDLEGTENQGYVPTQDGKVLGKSGVTIASGFDLGQRRNADLSGLPIELIQKLQPYLGVKGEDALKLNYTDLNLSNDEVSVINKFAKNEALENLSKSWMDETGVSFYNIPKEAQTVIASVAFQHGNLSTAAPNFWKQVTNGDWNGAIDNLEDWEGTGKDSTYQTRREKEANLLRKIRPAEEKVKALDKLIKKYGYG